MLVFLDFDGVLHPECPDPAMEDALQFCHLPRFEQLMREFAHIDVVISSMWRYHHSLDDLKEFFSEDIRHRIIDTTPLKERVDGKYLNAEREKEILEWISLNGHHEREWLAIDDASWQFHHHKEKLIDCKSHRGFDRDAASRFREVVYQISGTEQLLDAPSF